MSQSIWTRCAGSSRFRPLALEPWRVVESQFVTSTRKLVDSDEEQETLERLLETVKPPLPPDPALARLHFLLFTSFRHPPLRHGSRFGTRVERGIWYGSLTLPTAFSEVAYYRLVFLDGTSAPLETVTVDLSAFRASVRARRAIDLTIAPFGAHERAISSPTSYSASQQLGKEMRSEGVEAIVYTSARDREHGKNVALFTPAFARRTPSALSAWICSARRDRVEIARRDLLRKQRFTFSRTEFEVGGVLPTPAI